MLFEIKAGLNPESSPFRRFQGLRFFVEGLGFGLVEGAGLVKVSYVGWRLAVGVCKRRMQGVTLRAMGPF